MATKRMAQNIFVRTLWTRSRLRVLAAKQSAAKPRARKNLFGAFERTLAAVTARHKTPRSGRPSGWRERFFLEHCGHGLGCACLRSSSLQPSRGRERNCLDLMLATTSSYGNCATASGNWPLLLGNGQRATGNGNGQRASWERIFRIMYSGRSWARKR